MEQKWVNKKKPRRLLIEIIFVLMIAGKTFVYAAEEETVIKVGFPQQPGFSVVDENGNYSGYTYDYLKELEQYLGWKYEFVTIPGDIDSSFGTMLEMLKNGEIDLLGALNYSEGLSELYDFSEEGYGTASAILAAMSDNVAVTEDNYRTFDSFKIGIVEGTTKAKVAFEDLCRLYDWSPRIVYYKSPTEQLSALRAGEIDAVLEVDLGIEPDMKVIEKFPGYPFYFGVTKGRTDIIEKLNIGMRLIRETNPYYTQDLYDKYFENRNQKNHLTLSDSELEYIKNAKTLKVVLTSGRAPLQYFENGECRGIMVDFINYVSKKTGLKFEFIAVNSQLELKQALLSGEADLLAGTIFDYEVSDYFNVALTHPIISSPVMMVMNNKVDSGDLENKVVAVPNGFNAKETNQIEYFDTVEQCISAVNKGKADYCVANGYAIQYFANKATYRNIYLLSEQGETQDISVGIAKPVNMSLLSIFNKVIETIPKSEIQAMIYQNTTHTMDKISIADWLLSNPEDVVGIVVVFSVFIIGIMGWNLYSRSKRNRQIIIDNERYQQLSKLSNECMFEYNVVNDILALSENGVQFFGYPKEIRGFAAKVRKQIEQGDKELQYLLDYITGCSKESEELLVKLADNSKRWIRIISKTVKDAAGRNVYLIGKTIDIQKEKEEKEIWRSKAQKDSLTNIYNIASAKQIIVGKLETKRENSKSVLIIMDIDRFKDVNDKYGHYSGDQVLIETAGLLKSVFREEDIIGRLGGDEFIVFMEEVKSIDFIEERCRSLLEKMKGIVLGGEKNKITLSIGAVWTQEKKEYNELYKKADAALYIVKKRGRNGFEIVN